MKKIINVFIFISIAFLFLPMALAKKTVDFVILPEWYNKCDCHSKQALIFKENATTKALCDDYVKQSLLGFQDRMHYKKWKLSYEKNESTGDWLITIKSKGLIPSASCFIKMNASGNSYFKKCDFNK